MGIKFCKKLYPQKNFEHEYTLLTELLSRVGTESTDGPVTNEVIEEATPSQHDLRGFKDAHACWGHRRYLHAYSIANLGVGRRWGGGEGGVAGKIITLCKVGPTMKFFLAGHF